jgi:hypothetical protein
LFFIAFPLFKEDRTGVGAVDAHVTHRASLALGVLRVRRVIEVLVTLQTESVHARSRQQPRIRGTVRRVTRRTTFGSNGFMLEYERTALFSVALVADRILRGIGAQLFRLCRSVHIVTILALDVAFHDSVTEWLQEIGFRFVVAAEAKIRILLDQQLFPYRRDVGGVAGSTSDAVAVVNGAIEILVLEIVLVARHATFGDLLGFLFTEAEDLGLVSAAINVGGARTMARFASMPFLSATLRRENFVMCSALNVFELVFVTRLAIVGTDVLRGIPRFRGIRRLGLLFLRRSSCCRATEQDQRRDQHGGEAT